MRIIRPIFLVSFLSFFVIIANAQKLEILTEEQLKVCSSEQGLLSATTNGTVLFSQWTPTQGLNNPLSLNSLITNPFDTTYTLRVKGFLGDQNLLRNSDFSEGNTGFTSQYEYESTKPGGYIIGKIGTELFPDAKECEDHTTPEAGGNMLMVRVSETSNVDIYCQEITILPNTAYHFKGFATGLVLNSPPIIVLKINEEVISIGTLGSFACSWQQVNGDWNSKTATTAKVCLSVSDEDIGAGTDFVLDDIGFYEVFEVEKEVAVEVVDFEVTIAETIGLTCGDSLGLSATVIPEELNFIIEWTSVEGHFVKGENTLSPIIDAVGTYELSVRTTINEQVCSAAKTVEVVSSNEDMLTIGASGNLHCNQQEISLAAIDSVNRAAFIYQWTNPNGQIISETRMPTIQIDQPGIYQLERTTLAGNCVQQAEIMIAETSPEDFTFEAMKPSCDNPRGAILFDEIIGGAAPFLYSIDNGNSFLTDRFFPDLTGGTYPLVVQDANECEVTQMISFASFINIPLDLPNSIRLESTTNFQLPLQINAPDSLVETIEWQPSFGLSCIDCPQPFLTSKNDQIYTVTVTDINGCTTQASIEISIVEASYIYLPTAFSPNGDGQNDIFQIHSNTQRIEKVNQFKIFDRYGNLVFNQRDFLANDARNGWDGMYKGRLMPIGVYVYWVEVVLTDGESAVFSGEVGLVK